MWCTWIQLNRSLVSSTTIEDQNLKLYGSTRVVHAIYGSCYIVYSVDIIKDSSNVEAEFFWFPSDLLRGHHCTLLLAANKRVFKDTSWIKFNGLHAFLRRSTLLLLSDWSLTWTNLARAVSAVKLGLNFITIHFEVNLLNLCIDLLMHLNVQPVV